MWQLLLTVSSLICVTSATKESFPLRAMAITESGDGKVKGNVILIQEQANGPVTLKLLLSGATPGLHGFHIHENAIRNNDCLTGGGHFNPDGNKHHGKSDPMRHLGDLGNVVADENGIINREFEDSVIQLHGASSVIGRSFVLHANADDLGMGSNAESSKTGNAGARIACGNIMFQ